MPAIKCFEVSVPNLQDFRPCGHIVHHRPFDQFRLGHRGSARVAPIIPIPANADQFPESVWTISRGPWKDAKWIFAHGFPTSHITAKLSQVETLMDPSYWTLKGAAMLTMLNDWGALWQGDGGLASYFYTNISLYFNTFDYFSYFAHVWFIFIVYNLWWSLYFFLVAVGCSWQPWLIARNFASEITASKNIGRMLGKTSPAMFRSHPCGKSESKEHVTLPCWNSVFGDSSRNRIDRQWQVLASHWQWYSWSKCKLFISFCHWKLTHELSHGERPKVTIIIRIERMRHTARCVLPVRSVPSKSDFSWLNIRCSKDLLRAWISRTIDRSQHLGLIFSASPRLVMFGCHNLKRSQPLEAFWPRLWPPQRKRQLLGESL